MLINRELCQLLIFGIWFEVLFMKLKHFSRMGKYHAVKKDYNVVRKNG
jgi:hypothetical protein